MIPTTIYPDTLDHLRAKLTTPPIEPIYDATVSDHQDMCEPWDWQPGGLGTVLDQLDRDTNPRPHRSHLLRTQACEESRAVLRAVRGGATHAA